MLILNNSNCSLIICFSADFVKPRRRYLELGQFDYQGETYTEDFGDKVDIAHDGTKYYYVGQFKNGTNKRDGIGMIVWVDGYTQLPIIILLMYIRRILQKR